MDAENLREEIKLFLYNTFHETIEQIATDDKNNELTIAYTNGLVRKIIVK